MIEKIVTFLRVLLKINWNDCSFFQLLLAINRYNFWKKNIKATFASGKSRWLKKSEYIFTNFVGDKFRWLQLSRLVLAINRDDCSYFFFEHLTPDCNCGPMALSGRKPTKMITKFSTCKCFQIKNIKPYPSRDNC